jgi:colanic acid/amylovoran biosynthesis glycosyltransferase
VKIAFLVGGFPLPSETFILRQLTGLLDRGHDVRVFADRPPAGPQHAAVERYRLLERTCYRPFASKKPAGRALRALPLLPRALARNPRGTAALLDVRRFGRVAASLRLFLNGVPHLGAERWDVAHAHFGQLGVAAVRLRRCGLLDAPIVTTFHGMDANRVGDRRYVEELKLLFEEGDLFTVNSGFTRDRIVELGCPPERIRKLPVGLDVERYAFRARRPSPGEPVRLLTVGRLVEKKGHEYAIRAVARLARKGHALRYDIVGDGPRRDRLESLIADLGMGEAIRLLGPRSEDDVEAMLGEAQLFVLASVTARDGDREGQALVLQEAQAVGLPVVSTRHNGIPEGVAEGASAILVPERDEVALAGAIGELVEHPERWEAMGRSGRAFVAERFAIDGLNDHLVEVYGEAIASARRAAA